MIRSHRRPAAGRSFASRWGRAAARLRSGALAVVSLAAALAVVSVGTGCEEDTQPLITRIAGNPLCGAMTPLQPDSTLGLQVQFFARASSGNRFDDPTGANSALKWYWDFDGDGTIDAEDAVQPSFTYRRAGDYQVTLTVKDSDGDEDSRTLLVQVRDASTELDILEFEAEARTEVVIESTLPENTGVTLEGDIPAIEDLPLKDRVVLSAQPFLEGWRATFDGKLVPACEISDIFNQYRWTWGFDDGYSVTDLDAVIRDYEPSRRETVTGTVKVTEVVTGIERTDVVESVIPMGAAMTAPRLAYIAPGASATMDVNLYVLPEGLESVSVRIEYDALLELESIDTSEGLTTRGFSAAENTDEENFVSIEMTADAPLALNVDQELLARLTFRNASEDLDVPRERPVRIRTLEAFVDTLNVARTTRGARLVADVADCNDNQLGDTLELLSREVFVDRSRDGVIDYCQDCNENSTPDGEEVSGDWMQDVDVNGIPDDCDCNGDGRFDSLQLANGAVEDEDGNGYPDDCDCDWNGRLDLVEILEADGFAPNFQADLSSEDSLLIQVPYNQLFDYRVSIDRIDGNPLNDPADFDVVADQQPDGILDFCQDCNDDGILDILQYTVEDDVTQPPAFASQQEALRVDLDGNAVLDECDCNGNDRFDRGEIERGSATVAEGLLEECDCNDNLQNDLVEISDAIIGFIAGGAGGYISALDGNQDQQIDACADCDENGTLDGEDFASRGPLSDIDANFLLDDCDCNSDERYDPPLDPNVSDLDENGVIDICDCDLNAVADLEQISAAVTAFTVDERGRVDSYTSPEDGFTLVNNNDDDIRTPWEEVELNPVPDQIPDICQDCNANGVADIQEVTREIEDQFLNRLDLDRNFVPDDCDCNADDIYDSVEIQLDPSLDGDSDGQIDECDCNDNGILDISEIAELAVFDGDTGIYIRADGINGDGVLIQDVNGNLVLDQCEDLSRATTKTWSGERTRSVRGERR